MGKKLKKMVGKYCKVVVREDGHSRAEVVTGVLEKVSYKDGFVYLTTTKGNACYRIDNIVAVKKIQSWNPMKT